MWTRAAGVWRGARFCPRFNETCRGGERRRTAKRAGRRHTLDPFDRVFLTLLAFLPTISHSWHEPALRDRWPNDTVSRARLARSPATRRCGSADPTRYYRPTMGEPYRARVRSLHVRLSLAYFDKDRRGQLRGKTLLEGEKNAGNSGCTVDSALKSNGAGRWGLSRIRLRWNWG